MVAQVPVKRFVDRETMKLTGIGKIGNIHRAGFAGSEEMLQPR
jgi:hypothetical protein